MRTSLFFCLFLFSCSPKISERINQTKSAFGTRCAGVNSLTWQEQIQGADAATTAKLITDLTLAAEADAQKSEDLKTSGKVDLNVKSELAKVINANTKQSSKVSEGFWQQEVRFGETMCLYLSLLDRKDLPSKTKENIIDNILKVSNSYNEYELNKPYDAQSQKNINNGVNNGIIGDNNRDININTKPTPSAEQKNTTVEDIKRELLANHMDAATTKVYVLVATSAHNPDANYFASDLDVFLRDQGYIMPAEVNSVMTINTYKKPINVNYDSNYKCINVIIYLPKK